MPDTLTLTSRLTWTGPVLWPWELAWTVNGTITITWYYREEIHARYEAKVMEHLFKLSGYEVTPLAPNPLKPEQFSQM